MGDAPTTRRPGALSRWLYRTGRPGRLAAAANRVSAWIGQAGLWPDRLVALEVRGRRTGRVISFPLVVADLDGQRYLVAMLGAGTSWVANVRAAGGRAVLRAGTRRPVRLVELDPELRAPVLRRYLAVAPGGRPHLPVDRHAPLAEFERIAAGYPVFRIEPDPDPPGPA